MAKRTKTEILTVRLTKSEKALIKTLSDDNVTKYIREKVLDNVRVKPTSLEDYLKTLGTVYLRDVDYESNSSESIQFIPCRVVKVNTELDYFENFNSKLRVTLDLFPEVSTEELKDNYNITDDEYDIFLGVPLEDIRKSPKC